MPAAPNGGTGVGGVPEVPQGLQDFCRLRIREMIQQVKTAVAASAPARKGEGGAEPEPSRRYMVIVVDARTQRILSASCQMQHLVEEGVCLVESMNAPREGLRALDCIYFIEPTLQNATTLVKDASAKKPLYRSFHVFWSQRLPPELLKAVAGSPEAVARIKTFVELNFSFIAFDHRSFHMDDNAAALDVLLEDESLSPEVAAAMGCQLASLCTTLRVKPRIFHLSKSSGMDVGKGVCEQVAQELHKRLGEIESQSMEVEGRPTTSSWTASVVIVERGFDWGAAIAHDMTYEPLAFDLLGGDEIKVEDSTYRCVDPNDESARTAVLSEEADTLWDQYRSLPLWVVNDLIVDEVKQYAYKDEKMRSGNSDQSVAETLQALQSLPAHKEYFTKLQVHSDICTRCFAKLEEHSLVSLATFEQDLLTRVEGGTTDPVWRLERRLKSFISQKEVRDQDKVRLLLLHFACSDAETPLEKQSEYAEYAQISDKDAETVQSYRWSKVIQKALQRFRPRSQTLARRRQSLQQWTQAHENSTYEVHLRRFQPKLRELMEDACAGQLDSGDFQEVKAVGSQAVADVSSRSSAPQCVIVFVVGGLSLPEVRVAQEVSSAQSNAEIFVGGSCLLTPSKVMQLVQKN